jgi:hypothetical protein
MFAVAFQIAALGVLAFGLSSTAPILVYFAPLGLVAFGLAMARAASASTPGDLGYISEQIRAALCSPSVSLASEAVTSSTFGNGKVTSPAGRA